MNHFFLSKYDNVNWSWWNETSISRNDKQYLDAISSQLKAFLPAKFLYFLGSEPYCFLVTERNQVDRDNDGRPFSARQLKKTGAATFDEPDALKRELISFSEPVDYTNPDTLAPSSQPIPSMANANVLFNIVWNSFLNGQKICIINEEIDRYAQRSRAQITAMVFSTFPEASALIDALNILPPALVKRICVCFNYENELIDGSEKLGLINIIYCGNKTLVEHGFEENTDIRHDLLKKAGFEVVNTNHSTFNAPDWSNVHSFLKKFSDPHNTYRHIFDEWLKGHSKQGIQRMVQCCTLLASLEKNITGLEAPFELVRELVIFDRISSKDRAAILAFSYRSLKEQDRRDQFYLYSILSGEAKVDYEFAQNIIPSLTFFEQFTATQKADFIGHETASKIPAHSRAILFQLFWSPQYDRQTFSNDAVQRILLSYPEGTDFPDLRYLWHEFLADNSPSLVVNDIVRLVLLYEKTGNKQAFTESLTRGFTERPDNEWLRVAGTADVKLKMVFAGKVSNMVEVVNWFSIIGTEHKALSKESLQSLVSETEKIIDESDDLKSLVAYHYITGNSRVLQELSVYKEVMQKLEARIIPLLIRRLRDNPSEYVEYLPDKIKVNESLFHTLYFLAFEENFGTRLDTAFLLNSIRLMKTLGYKHDFLKGIITQLYSEAENLHSTSYGNARQIKDELYKELITLKKYKDLPQGLLKTFINGGGLGFIQRNKMMLLGLLGIGVVAILLYHFFVVSAANSPPVQAENTNTTTGNTQAPVDSTSLRISAAISFINLSIFSANGDTLGLKEFKKRTDSLKLIRFRFSKANFSEYEITGGDTASSNTTWSWFVTKYKDSLSDLFELNIIKSGKDSLKKVTGINLKK